MEEMLKGWLWRQCFYSINESIVLYKTLNRNTLEMPRINKCEVHLWVNTVGTFFYNITPIIAIKNGVTWITFSQVRKGEVNA